MKKPPEGGVDAGIWGLKASFIIHKQRLGVDQDHIDPTQLREQVPDLNETKMRSYHFRRAKSMGKRR
jgi:hypothetical protein